MRTFLPATTRIIALFLTLQIIFSLFAPVIPDSLGQTATPRPTTTITPTPTIPSSMQQNEAEPSELPGDWIIDPEVTNIGKNAARAGIFLDWAIQNYDWAYVDIQSGKSNPLIPFWVTLRNIVYAFLILVVIAGSLTLIITRGRSVTLRRFIPRFLVIVILVTFSFAFVEFLYQIVDVIQGFFIRPGGVPISQKDLLFIGWKYQPFVGLRALGSENFESAFISLLLVKLTSFTYYAMVGILLIRKIILWFFIMISPFFPLLLLFYPLRNTAKIWLGEFFRWLLYAPLFAIFLAGLVSLWKTGIPLFFNFNEAGNGVIFPTAVSILLGGPLQKVGVANSVNLADTFGLYIVALLMLWMVIIFPFILLQIFLDYLSNINVNQNALARQLVNFMTRPPSPSGGTPPPSPVVTGLARALPFIRDFAIPKPTNTGAARAIPRTTQTQQQQQTTVVRPVSVQQKESVEKLTNMSVPTLRDIAKFESIKLQKDTVSQKEVERIREALQNIANPESALNSADRTRYTDIKNQLSEQSKNGNHVATSVIKAAQQLVSQSAVSVHNVTSVTTFINHLANPASVTSTKEREKYVEVREKLVREQERNNTLATSVMSAVQAMTTSSKNTLQTLIQTLAHPEEVSQKLKNTVVDLKQALKEESAKGSELAKTVLSVFEKLERIEKVSSSLLNVQNPGIIKETKEKERFERIKETLIREKERGNTLATTILTQITKLTSASSTDEKSQVVQTIKEEVSKEKENNNTLADFISQSLPELMQADGTATLTKIQGELEEAKSAGNPLAAKLLAIAHESSVEKQREQLSSLQSEIAQAKAKGDPLATTLSDILYPKPKLASKPEAFPTVNRIQEVSLDDYEAVKKMWTENYQNLDTTGNLGDNVSKKDWIQDDIGQISDTIDLLTSENAEKVEEGMEKVSDILPFLLVGGFSQSEIVAYLKAKQAAAKDVLSDLEKQGNDEDTKITVEHHATAVPKAASVSAAVSDTEYETTPSVHTQDAPRVAPMTLPVAKLMTTPSASSTQMLRLANISIPSIRTVASYDEALLSHDTERSQEVEKIQQTLRSIANPSSVSDQAARARFGDIHSSLVKESEQGNAVAASLVSAGRLMGRLTAQATFVGVLQLQQLLQQLSDASGMKDEDEKRTIVKLLEAIRLQGQNGNRIASEVVAAIDKKENLSLLSVFSLRENLKAAADTGDELASGLLGKASQAGRDTFVDVLGEVMGTYLLVDALSTQKSLFTDESGETARVIAEVRKNAETGSDLAKDLLAVKEKNDYPVILALVAKIESGSDHFSKNLRSSLKKFNSASFLVQSNHTVVQQALSKVLSLITTSLDRESPQITALHQQLIDAKKNGNALAGMILTKADQETRSEMGALGKILSNLEKVESLTDAGEKASYIDLKARLQKEKATNNELADQILAVAHVFGNDSASALDKSTISVMLWEKLNEAKNQGDQIAQGILEKADSITLQARLNDLLSDLIISLKHPEAISSEKRREQYLTLKSTVGAEVAKGNAIAKKLQSLIKPSEKATDPVLIQTLSTALEEEAEKGNSLSADLLSLLHEEEKGQLLFAILHMMRGIAGPESLPLGEEKDEYRKLREELQKESEADSVLAMSLLAAAERAKAQGDDLSEAKKLQELLSHDASPLSQSIHAFIDNEVERYEDILMLRSLLHGMENPEYVPDVTVRGVLETLQKELLVEAQHANPVAKTIEKTLHEIGTQGVAVDKELQSVTELYGQLLQAEREGSTRAKDMIGLIHAQHLRVQASRLALVMEYIADPTNAPIGHDQDAYKAIKQTLILERNKGNQFASFLLSIAQSFSSQRIKEEDMQAILALLYQKLTEGESEGNSFAMSILSRIKPDKESGTVDEIETVLLREKDDPVARAVFSLIDSEHEKNRIADGVVLPAVNRIQEVSLDDYEAVRSMWEESFRTLDVPQKMTGERPSREEWLRGDVERMQSTVTLLTSVDQEKINEGMQQVSGILPFLLVGGFSLAEIIAYLKAKLQAAKTVLAEQAPGDRPEVQRKQNEGTKQNEQHEAVG